MKLKTVLVIFVGMLLFSSCSAYHKSMKEANARVELRKDDFTFSKQVSAEATSNLVFGIDIERLFTKKTAEVGESAQISLASLPVVGSVVKSKVEAYALYELMEQNPGYDVIFYPSFEKRVVRPLGIPFILQTTTVKATGRLGKLK